MIKHHVTIVDVFSSPASNGLQKTSIFAHPFFELLMSYSSEGRVEATSAARISLVYLHR